MARVRARNRARVGVRARVRCSGLRTVSERVVRARSRVRVSKVRTESERVDARFILGRRVELELDEVPSG